MVSPASVLWYAWNLLSNQLYLLPFLLFVCGVVLLFRRPEAARKNLYPVLLIASCYVSFTLLANKDSRYSEPMLIGVAVVATYWLDDASTTPSSLRRRSRRRLRRRALLRQQLRRRVAPAGRVRASRQGLPVLSDFTGPCPGSSIPALQSLEPSGEIANRRGIRIWSQNGFVNGPPSGERWYQEEMFEEAARSSPSRTLYFQVLPSTSSGSTASPWTTSPTSTASTGCHLAQADFAGVRTVAGEQPPELPGFREVRHYELPAGGALTLYARAM